ncbi:MAG: SDR family NAD(P)-dependent oxidoreductase [Spirosomaceae bacterium]|jgi:3-dehydrosphinganine reductase|nr:SDR family NAD(P)-dependent oxidoreductase [Spirosomataceae bacterium]
MRSFNKKNVVITGGSSGIGLATAKEFARFGANLFILARGEAGLQKAKTELLQQFGTSIKVEIFPVDVSNQSDIQHVIDYIGTKSGIDVLINNAGLGGHVRFEEVPLERLQNTMNINYWGAVYATKAAWQYLKASGGNLAFVSSLAGYTGIYGFSNYSPTKFALTGLAEVLRMEGKDHGIGVTVLYPPDTDTPMMSDERRTPIPETVALSNGAKLVSPEVVAQRFISGIQQDRFEVLCNTQSHLVRILRGTIPRVYFWILDQIVEKDRKKRKNNQKEEVKSLITSAP